MADPNMALTHAMSGLTIGPGGEQLRGTVTPCPSFNPETDCQALRQAMRGAGTDEKAIVSVVSNRSADQRQAIKKMYKTMFGKDLIDNLKSELSGNFSKLMIALFADPEYYDAHCLRDAMKGAGTSEGILIEIMCTRTNAQIEAIKARYKTEFKRDLEKDLVSETSGQFKRLLVSCVQANRAELTPEQYEQMRTQGVQSILDMNQVAKDAEDLYSAGAKRWGTDESVFLRIIATRTVYHLRAVFDEYARRHGKDIISVIKSEMSGDTESGYKAIAESVINRPAYFAKQLHKSMAGLGTNDSQLIRLVVTRSEIDMANIKEEFYRNYNKTLESFIKGDTSGDYKHLLLNIVQG